ncbi:peptidylprolyl isomerase [Chitinimonas koreensis]|uniref:peptidylprolyl isomerase n=1 Tax=Chitinimonas koreensis TaxID=356302 RepID=UPI00040601C3|nr:peptidylprolyl isomerase [Chitinimonas koreensis]QNM95151.1 peptidyl-prolyl cis-trans isomerase [Chitinimonas koreensis]
MPVIVNGVELSDADMERELPGHRDAPNPLRRAATALVLRRVLLDEAHRLGLPAAGEEAAIAALLAAEAPVPLPDEETCRRHYRQHPEHFTVGELVEAGHILFQVTLRVPLAALRALAERTLAELLAEPERFEERARALSNCPSGELGGNLGQLGRGDTVPEFERVLFAMQPGQILPRLLETRFGLHIVRTGRRAEGRLLPYERVAETIAAALHQASQDTAWRQYLQLLVGRARIEGIELEGAESLLVQ